MTNSTSSASRSFEPVQETLWSRRAWWFLGAILVLRVAYLALGLTDLSPDEAYYWHWSERLDWCYYSKPPMVAWIMAAFTWAFEASTFFVRLPAALLTTSMLLALFLLARRLFGARAGFYSLAAMALTPGATVLSLIMTIDPPLVASWSLSLLLVWRAAEQPERLLPWIVAGVMVALGLLSKPSMLAFPGLLLLWAALRQRSLLARSGLWLFVVTSLLAFVPILYWNSQNDWITFGHAADHFTPGEDKPILSLKTFGEFFGAQLGLLSPVTFVLFAWALIAGLRRLRSVDLATSYLVVFSAVPMACILLLSLRQRVHANWSAPFYLAGMVLLGAWASGALDLSEALDRRRSWFRPALITGALLVLVTWSVPLWYAELPVGGTRKDPTFRVRGWAATAAAMDQRLKKAPRPEQTMLIGSRRQYVSQLHFYGEGHPLSFREPRQRIESQYELWGGPRDHEGWDAFIVTDAEHGPTHELVQAFERVTTVEPIHVPLGAGGGRTLAVHWAEGLRAWPHPQRESQP